MNTQKGYVYVVSNLENGKTYVGQTRKNLMQRWAEHIHSARQNKGYLLHKAIRKYGETKFDLQVLAETDNKQSLDNLEKLWIILLQSTNEQYGYNLAPGGLSNACGRKKGFKHSEETRQKIRLALQNSPRAKAQHERLSTLFSGQPLSTEHKLKLSAAKKGKPWSAARRKALETRYEYAAA